MQRDHASTTARKVALNILALGAKPGMEEVLPTGIVDATARVLIESGVVGRRAVRFASSRAAVAIYEAFDWMLPGQFEAFAHRKAFCERQVREGIAEGVTQVLVLGAGYDTLGWRLAPEFPEVAFFEIDHPATARLKARAVTVMGSRENLHLIAEDLGARALGDVLDAESAWQHGARTAIVAEGLFMYLPIEAVKDVLRRCAVEVGSGSRFAFSYVATGDDGRPDVGRWTGLVLWLLKKGGEPWLSSIRPGNLPQLLRACGWRLDPATVHATQRRGLEFLQTAIRNGDSP